MVVRSIFSVADWILLLLLLSFSCVSYINIFGSLLLSALSAGYSMVSSVKKKNMDLQGDSVNFLNS